MPRIGLHRYVASGVLALLHLALALVYTVPALTPVPSAQAGRLSIVAQIDSLGPTWTIAFGATGAVLAAALAVPRWLAAAHTVAVVPLAVYAAALWVGWALSQAPRPSIVSALLATAVMVWHPTLCVTYARLTATARTIQRHRRRRG